MTELILTEDNRLIAKNRAKSFEILGYVTEFYINFFETQLRKIKKQYLANTIGQQGLIRMTDKQWQVIQFWQNGKTNIEIAKEAKLTPQSVSNIKKRIMDKVDQLKKDSDFRLKTEKEYRDAWSKSRLYRVQYVAHESLGGLTSEESDENSQGGLEDIFFTDEGQATKNTQGSILRKEMLSLLSDEEQQLAEWLEDGFSPKECHEKLLKLGRKTKLQAVYKMIYRMRDKLKDYKND